MFVIVRDSSGNPVNNFVFQPEHYLWSALGGPEAALIKVSSTHQALTHCLDMLRFPVEIYDSRLNLVWWGFVNKVILQDDATRITRSIQSYSNTIGSFYTDEDGQEQFTGFVKSEITEKYDRYGEKQILLDISQRVDNQITNDKLLEILEHFRNIPPTMETSRGDSIGASLECVGWGQTLEWQHTPYRDRGKYGEQDGYPVEGDPNDFRYAHIIYTPQTQFLEGRLAQYANYRMSQGLWNDSSSDDHYFSHAIIPLIHSDPVTGQGAVSTFGGVRLEVLSAGNENPLQDQTLSSPGSVRDNGPFIDQADITSAIPPNPTNISNIVPTTFRWSNADVLAPSNGWYFSLRSAGNRLAVPLSRYCFWYRSNAAEPRPNRYLWYQVRGSSGFGTWNAWRDRLISGYNIPQWIQIPFEFYTRLGASALIKHVIQNHSIIRSSLYPNPPATDEKFAAYLNGRETMASAIKNMCAVDDLFYTITPDRTLKLYEVPSDPEESHIVMKADGTLSVNPQGDLRKIVGKWVYDNSTRGIHGLCTAARYEVRTGAYDLSFRGAPSLAEISTRVLQ